MTAETYLGLVALYEVRDVNPPPPATVIITKEFSAVFDTSTSFEVAIDDFEVPTGYVAQSFTLSQNGFSGDWTTEDAFIIVSGTHRYLRDGDFYSDLDGESDKVPIVLCGKGWSLLMLGCTVDLECAVAPEFLLRGSSTPTQKSSPPTRSLNSTTRSGCAPMKSSRCGDRWP